MCNALNKLIETPKTAKHYVVAINWRSCMCYAGRDLLGSRIDVYDLEKAEKYFALSDAQKTSMYYAQCKILKVTISQKVETV